MISIGQKLPNGWVWSTIGDIISDLQPGFASGKKNVQNGLSHLRMNNISSNCTLDVTNIRKVPPELAKGYHILQPSDILFCHTNSKKLVGKNALFNLRDGKYAFSNHLSRIRPIPTGPLPEWIWLWLTNLWRDRYFETKCKQWVNQATVDRQNILSAPIPIAPLSEQNRIIRKVKNLRTKLDELKEIIVTISPMLSKIRPSILNKAFSGKFTENINSKVSPSAIYEEILEKQKYLSKNKFDESNEYLSLVTIGKPNDWVWIPIGLSFQIEMGQSPPGNSYNTEQKGVPLLNGPTEFGSTHPTPIQWTTSPTKICNKGDLLICVRGSTTGRMNWADQSYCIGRGLAAIRPLSPKLKSDQSEKPQ